MTFYAKGFVIQFTKREKFVDEMNKEENVIKLAEGVLEWDEESSMFRFNSEKLSMIWWINLISGYGSNSKTMDDVHGFLEIADSNEIKMLSKYYQKPEIEENECNICKKMCKCLYVGCMNQEILRAHFCQSCINQAFYVLYD